MATVSSPPAKKQQTHRSYTVEYKLSVLKWIEQNNSSLRAASIHFGLDRKVLRRWIYQKTPLRFGATNSTGFLVTYGDFFIVMTSICALLITLTSTLYQRDSMIVFRLLQWKRVCIMI